jgi:hypothetical protein
MADGANLRKNLFSEPGILEEDPEIRPPGSGWSSRRRVKPPEPHCIRMHPNVRLLFGILVILLAAAAALFLLASPGDSDPGAAGGPPPEATGPLPSHEAFTRILSEVVRMPGVDYARLQEERQLLDAYLADLARTAPDALAAAPRDDALAFWINAYNACMLKVVIDHYPIEAGGTGLFGWVRNRVAGYPDNSVWQIRDVFTRDHCRVAGADRSQDEIEHEIIRPEFDEPRIHFAVNCAAVSCPVLWPEAYTGAELEAQLERAVTHLMEDPRHFRLDAGPPPTLTLNRVLDWYAEDFGGVDALPAFFLPRLSGDDATLAAHDDLRVEFFDYDWTLNDLPR